MIVSYQFKRLLLMSFFVFATVSACSQENGRDTEIVQAEAYIDIADLYRQQGQFRSAFIEIQNALQLVPGYERALITLARTDIDLGDSIQAVQILEALHESSAADESLTLLLAEAHMSSNNLDQAISLLDAFETADVENQAQRLWVLGMSHMASNNPETATEIFQELLNINPESVRALTGLSQLAYFGGDLENARSYIDQADALGTNDLDLWIWKGVYFTQNGLYPDAEEAFFEALDIMGTYDTYTSKRLSVLQAIVVPLQMQQKDAEALRYLQIIADTPQGQFRSSFDNAVESFQEGDFGGATETLNEILAVAPNNPDSNILMGLANYALGDYSAAAASLSGFTEAASSSQPARVLASTQLQLGNIDEAISTLRSALARFPDDPYLYAMLGYGQYNSGRIEESIDTFDQALSLDSSLSEVHYLRAYGYYAMNELDSAENSLLQAISLNPDFLDAKTGLIGFYINNNQLQEATQQVQEWLSEDSQSVFHNNLAGRVAVTVGETDQARIYFNASLNTDPTDVEARLSLARVLLSEQDLSGAESEFTLLLQRDPTNQEALSGLLAISQAQGTESERIEQIQELISDYPGDTGIPVLLSQFLLSRGEIVQALETAQLAYERDNNPVTQTNLINVQIRRALVESSDRNFITANQAIEEATALQSDNISTLAAAAVVANRGNDDEQAAFYVDQLKTLQPESGIGAELEGDLLVLNENLEPALVAYREAWDAGQRSSSAVKVYSTLIRLDRTQESNEFLESWLEAWPFDGSANLYTAMRHQAQDQIEDAIEHYETAYPSLSGNILVLNNLAWLYQDSNPERALFLASRAAMLFPDNPDVLDTYGWILSKQNRQEEALEILRRAQQLAPDSEIIAEHLDAIQ